MKDFVVSEQTGAGFPVGSVLLLDKDQATRRSHAVRVLSAAERLRLGRFKVGKRVMVLAERPIMFKRGERIGVVHCGSLDKRALAPLVAADTAEAEIVIKDVYGKLSTAREKGVKPKRAKPRREPAAGTAETETAEDVAAGKGGSELGGPAT